MGRVKEVLDLVRAAFAMEYDIETCYEFVRKHSRSPKPNKRFIMKVINEVLEELK